MEGRVGLAAFEHVCSDRPAVPGHVFGEPCIQCGKLKAVLWGYRLGAYKMVVIAHGVSVKLQLLLPTGPGLVRAGFCQPGASLEIGLRCMKVGVRYVTKCKFKYEAD